MGTTGDGGGIEDRAVGGDIDVEGSKIFSDAGPDFGHEGRVIGAGVRLGVDGFAVVPLRVRDGFTIEIAVDDIGGHRVAIEYGRR